VSVAISLLPAALPVHCTSKGGFAMFRGLIALFVCLIAVVTRWMRRHRNIIGTVVSAAAKDRHQGGQRQRTVVRCGIDG
jgi:hypothetical protein